MSETNSSDLLLQGTVYDKKYFPYFVNFHFHDQASRTRNRIMELSPTQTCVIVPITPSNDPVLIQILLFARVEQLLKIGVEVIFFLRDNDSSEEDKGFLRAITQEHFADYKESISETCLTSALSKYEQAISSAMSPMEEQDDEIKGCRKDALALLLEAHNSKAQFLLIGQVEAYYIQYWLERISMKKSPLDICPIYLPELWLFAGSELYLSNSSKDMVYTLLKKSRDQRYRSIWEYCLHISVVAASLCDEDMSRRFLSYSFDEKDFISDLDKDINILSETIHDLFQQWSI
ncbi:MAG: hypothetical protein KAJ07_05835 [Planctomycetes bacterium]|nr:hypothetical protein [Planctomycetota bacterium]